MSDAPLLTETEHELLEALGRVANLFGEVVGRHPNTHHHDLAEVVTKIHDLQARVMAQAAARAYPDRYRMLGGVIAPKES